MAQASLCAPIFMGERHGFKVAWIKGTATSERSKHPGVFGNSFNLHVGVEPVKATRPCFLGGSLSCL